MPTEALEKIKQAESQAAQSIEKARADAANIIKNARAKADEEIRDAGDMARKAAAVAREAAETDSARRITRVNNEIRMETAAITETASRNRRKAVAFIVENLLKRAE